MTTRFFSTPAWAFALVLGALGTQAEAGGFSVGGIGGGMGAGAVGGFVGGGVIGGGVLGGGGVARPGGFVYGHGGWSGHRGWGGHRRFGHHPGWHGRHGHGGGRYGYGQGFGARAGLYGGGVPYVFGSPGYGGNAYPGSYPDDRFVDPQPAVGIPPSPVLPPAIYVIGRNDGVRSGKRPSLRQGRRSGPARAGAPGSGIVVTRYGQ